MKNLNIAIAASLKAAQAILKIYNDPESDFGIERKADNSPLTIADRKAHELIVEALAKTGIYILSEEGRHESFQLRRKENLLWIVDPLDGTKEFIKRNGEFTVNIALVLDGVPILGVVYLPVKQRLYFAMQGVGSYRLDDISEQNSLQSAEQYIAKAQALPLEAMSTRDKYTVVCSRSHLSDQTAEFIDSIKQKYGQIECINSGSSIKIALVAEGSADMYPRFAPTMEWDTAAGDAVARYAGAQVVRHDDQMPLEYNKEDLLNPWFIVKRDE